MEAIMTWFGSIFQVLLSFIQLALWLLQGMLNYSTVLQGAMNTLTQALTMLPGVVSSAIVAACAVLITLRILGRS